jgi:IS5 family transposase
LDSHDLFDRDWLKGGLGEALHAVMCGAGHNLSLILARLKAPYCALIALMATLMSGPTLHGDRQERAPALAA